MHHGKGQVGYPSRISDPGSTETKVRTVSKRTVRILLECILVEEDFEVKDRQCKFSAVLFLDKNYHNLNQELNTGNLMLFICQRNAT